MTDQLDQPVNPHPDFFIPLNLTLPKVDKVALQQHIIERLREQHKNSTRLWFNSSHAVQHDFKATQELADSFLNAYGLKSDIMGVFIVNPNLYDRNIHSDSARLETRLNFYEMSEAPGVVRWFEDTGDGYDDYRKNLDGIEFLDYTWPWVNKFKRNELAWEDLPPVVHSTSTACNSALVRTSYPHHVIQGPGLRITITCRVVDKETGSTTGTWTRLKKQFTSLQKDKFCST
jgi:hypothetical protein